MRRLASAGMALVALFAACSGDDSIVGRARIPTEQGVATDVTLERIEIDDGRSYEIHPGVESFATRSHEPMPLLAWKGKYIHVGVEGNSVRWIAGIGLVTGKPAIVRYSGIVESFDEGSNRATFEDGTVLEFADALGPPNAGREIVVEIDVSRDRVVRLLN